MLYCGKGLTRSDDPFKNNGHIATWFGDFSCSHQNISPVTNSGLPSENLPTTAMIKVTPYLVKSNFKSLRFGS